jgi:CheY-like chemotaxis protein
VPRRTRGTETILVAEDDSRLRALTRAALEGSGYTVLEAGDGEAAVSVAEQHAGPIDLLLTDVVMPKLGGRLLAERLASSFPAMKVIYVSGYTDDMVVRHGIVNATVEFLQKPFTIRALQEKVRQVLDGK